MLLIVPLNTRDLVEGLVGEEAVEQGERGGGLVHRHHVAGLVHLQEGQTTFTGGSLGRARQTAHLGRGGGILRVRVDPVLVCGGGELLVAAPGQGLGPGLVADPVADEVHITGVDQHAHATLQHGLQHLQQMT